jgi:hypothetical protein
MSTNEHPVTPPPELVKELYGLPQMRAIEKTYQAGADQELEACRKFISENYSCSAAERLMAARRPEPPSLQEEALAKTKALLDDPGRALLVEVRETLELNRRALESMPND